LARPLGLPSKFQGTQKAMLNMFCAAHPTSLFLALQLASPRKPLFFEWILSFWTNLSFLMLPIGHP
jgi:hypothetical protein